MEKVNILIKPLLEIKHIKQTDLEKAIMLKKTYSKGQSAINIICFFCYWFVFASVIILSKGE